MSHSIPHDSKGAKSRKPKTEHQAQEGSAVDHAAIEEIAAALQALINSRAQSPSKSEIASVIAKKIAPPAEPGHLSGKALADLARWDQEMREYLDYYEDENAEISISEEQLEEESERFCAVCREIWARPVTDWGDIVLLAAIAVYWNSDGDDGEPPYPDVILKGFPDPTIGADDNSLALLVRAILELTGLHFDVQGRLLTSLKRSHTPAGRLAQ
jgi:hypothetical protein